MKGITIQGVLLFAGAVLVVMKLAGISPVVAWPWLAVLAPLLIYLGQLLLTVIIGAVVVSHAAKNMRASAKPGPWG